MNLAITPGWDGSTAKSCDWPLRCVARRFRIWAGTNCVSPGRIPLLDGIAENAHAYFVHSFEFRARDRDVLATTDYGGTVTAMVGRDNLVGTQFHPEKSQAVGLQLLANFLSGVHDHVSRRSI